MDNQENLTSNQTLPKPKTGPGAGRGGYRPNSGRKHGSYLKLSGADILAQIAKHDIPFAVGLAQDYTKARAAGDLNIIQKYQQMILSKVIADTHNVDLTSNGKSLHNIFNFPQHELIDWEATPSITDVKNKLENETK